MAATYLELPYLQIVLYSMKKYYTHFAVGSLILFSVSCTTGPGTGLTTEPVDVAVTESVRNDKIIGTWRGVIPCADCPGISYNLTLNEDNSYEETLIYQDRSAQPYTQTGMWRVNEDVLELDNPAVDRSRFSLSENGLMMLNIKTGRPMETEAAGMYRLRRDNTAIGGNIPQWYNDRKQGIDFVAHGNNPGWMLEIDLEKNVFFQTLPLQEVSISAPIKEPKKSGNTTRYTFQSDKGKLDVELIKSECTDSMSGEVNAYTVKVTANGTTYSGCGVYLNAESK